MVGREEEKNIEQGTRNKEQGRERQALVNPSWTFSEVVREE
jgi:hypothetical protein